MSPKSGSCSGGKKQIQGSPEQDLGQKMTAHANERYLTSSLCNVTQVRQWGQGYTVLIHPQILV